MERDEALHLLSASRSKIKFNHKTFKVGFCISSKAALVIMVWHFAVLLGYKLLYNFDTYVQVRNDSFAIYISMIVLGTVAVFSLFIGLLADIKLSRYKTVLCSTYINLVQIVALLVIGVALVITLSLKQYSINLYTPVSIKVLGIALVGVMTIAFIVFLINGFHFAMDQLLNLSTDELIKFIHWYVWIVYVCILITETAWNLALHSDYYYKINAVHILGIGMLIMAQLTTVLLLVISLCIATRRKAWFLLEPPSVNPYTLLARVIKFAYKHKVPIRRSAFTYCEDESPSRLDLAKQKYGGPFTTRQVEDVKAFLGILKVLLTASSVFYLQIVTQTVLPSFARRNNVFILTQCN